MSWLSARRRDKAVSAERRHAFVRRATALQCMLRKTSGAVSSMRWVDVHVSDIVSVSGKLRVAPQGCLVTGTFSLQRMLRRTSGAAKARVPPTGSSMVVPWIIFDRPRSPILATE